MTKTPLFFTGTLLFAAVINAAAQPSISIVMSGLDNPRGLAFGPEGALYVAEAGRGGTAPCIDLRSSTACYGATGAVTRLWRGVQERVISGLPSYSLLTGDVTGPHDISFQGRGGAYVTIGWGGDPALRAGFGEAGALFGTLLKTTPGGTWRVAADVSAYESAANPAGGPVDSNPYGLLAGPGAHLVADAGANALLRVDANGAVSAIATFPSRPVRSTDAVPTSVAVGPDGALYVGELTGAPFTEGAARIYRVVPGSAPEVYLEGFKTIIDIDFGPDGSLFVLQHATGAFFSGAGEVIRVASDGARSVVLSDLTRPTSLLVDDDGTMYISNRGISIGTGEVLKVAP